MKLRFAGIIAFLALVLSAGFVAADRLPNQTPENQIFTIDTVVDVTGAIDSGTDMAWLIASPGAIKPGIIGTSIDYGDPLAFTYPVGNVIADALYKDSMLTNGGKMSENKNFDLNTKDQALGLYNIVGEKVLTYAGTEGAHMVGEEEYTLDVAGEAKKETDNIRCVFSTNHGGWLPPFCNVVSAKSALININSAQVSAKGQMRAVAKTDDIPAELNYQIAVTPDANSGSGFAEGSVKTTFAGSVMEGRGTGMYWTPYGADVFNAHFGPIYKAGDEVPWDIVKNYPGAWAELYWWDDGDHEFSYEPSQTNTWKDSTEVTGGIKNFQKAFAYKSGFKL